MSGKARHGVVSSPRINARARIYLSVGAANEARHTAPYSGLRRNVGFPAVIEVVETDKHGPRHQNLQLRRNWLTSECICVTVSNSRSTRMEQMPLAKRGALPLRLPM